MVRLLFKNKLGNLVGRKDGVGRVAIIFEKDLNFSPKVAVNNSTFNSNVLQG